MSLKKIFPNIDNFSYETYICIFNDIQNNIINNTYKAESDDILYYYFQLYNKYVKEGYKLCNEPYYNHIKILNTKKTVKLSPSDSEKINNILKNIYEKCYPTKLKKYSLIGSITLIIILCILYFYKNIDNFSGGTHYNFSQYNKSNKKLYKTLNKM